MKPLFLALSTLTLFPLPVKKWTSSQLKDSVVFYPWVGALLGGVLALANWVPFFRDLHALMILLLWVALTLAFHLDGLADCLDGWLGGKNPSERRRIMKDAALGVYGAVGIVLLLLSKYVLLEHLLIKTDAWKWLIALPALARWSAVVSCWRSSSPNKDRGLASRVLGLSFTKFLLSTLFVLALVPLMEWEILWGLLICAAVSRVVSAISRDRIGGLTGDGLGATIELSEWALLFLACLRFI